ncbi:CsbD family protein [Falsiroseomonas sp.]|uniref:CsbD family protein n=1 Tax=Falsiroseomonas sp. TaxID=2870721 RepID=UPI0034A506E7
MDRNRLQGIGNKIKGALKKAVGRMSGDEKLKAEGQADTAKGTVQTATGGARDAVRDITGKDKA